MRPQLGVTTAPPARWRSTAAAKPAMGMVGCLTDRKSGNRTLPAFSSLGLRKTYVKDGSKRVFNRDSNSDTWVVQFLEFSPAVNGVQRRKWEIVGTFAQTELSPVGPAAARERVCGRHYETSTKIRGPVTGYDRYET